MDRLMRQGYSYLELVVGLGVLAVLCGCLLVWQRGYVRQMQDTVLYYQERQLVLNRLAARHYERTENKDGLQLGIINWRGQEIITLIR